MIFTVVLVMLVGIFTLVRWSYWTLGIARRLWREEKIPAGYFGFLAVVCAAIPTAAVICLVDIGGGL